MLAVHNRMLTEEYHLACGNTCSSLLVFGSPLLSQNLACGRHLDVPAGHELIDDIIKQLSRDRGAGGDAAGMQLHMATLNAARCQSLQGSEVLREPNCGHQFRELSRGADASHAQAKTCSRVGVQICTDYSRLERNE